jgi:DNA modification methylase
MSAVLRLVQPEQFKEELDLPIGGASENCHSIQAAFQYCAPWKPYVARYAIERFSKKGSVVLDPFCSTGVSGVEAVLMGRAFVGCAQDHSLVKLARARLFPADIAEVALRLQFIPFKRPVELRNYSGAFPHFFDPDTFRELMNAKSSLRPSSDSASEFVAFIVASILHGHTSAYLSAYTSPSEGLSPEAQVSLNRKRGEVPSYRAVSARVLKKAAALLQDGVPSVLSGASKAQREVFFSEPTSIDSAQTGSVDLALVAPPQPGVIEHGLSSWLRTWWLGVDVPEQHSGVRDASGWNDNANELLLEMARVVKPGGRAVVRVGQGRIGSKPVNYRAEIESLINVCLQRFWRVEGAISERYVRAANARAGQTAPLAAELLVLRRK